MKCFAYTRVSTNKQGKGVSLPEQESAIAAYAKRHDLEIVAWFSEKKTAAKRGRAVFSAMLKRLRQGDAEGVLIHKIDRSARNLKDWAELGELIDAGVAVHFVNDRLDLLSRGGRLSADIQAIVAADYIRNLREEAFKGIRGRLKQGIYPFAAPLGYLNTGEGKPKILDPARAPFIRDAFQLYASGRYTLASLQRELYRRGFRNRRGTAVPVNRLSVLLNNPFYTGLLRLRSSGETYVGAHEPLITMALFKQVQARLAGKVRSDGWVHEFTFRGLFRCALCGHYLVGERQKGHSYYRCHTTSCPTKGFREERLEGAILAVLPSMIVTEDERRIAAASLRRLEEADDDGQQERTLALGTQLANVKARLTRLIDAYVDRHLEKEDFERRKLALLEEQRTLEDALEAPASTPQSIAEQVLSALELASEAQQSYRLADVASRREMIVRLCSNLRVSRKNVYVRPYYPLHVIGNRRISTQCGHCRNESRTLARMAWMLWRWFKRGKGATQEAMIQSPPASPAPSPPGRPKQLPQSHLTSEPQRVEPPRSSPILGLL